MARLGTSNPAGLTIEECWDVADEVLSDTARLADAEYRAYMNDSRSPLTEVGKMRLEQPFYATVTKLIGVKAVVDTMAPLPYSENYGD